MHNTAPERDRLLADVLSEDAPPGFREEVLDTTLRLARRRRGRRKLRRASVALVAISLLAVLVWRGVTPRRPVPDSAGRACELIRTQPLAGEKVVRTEPFLGGPAAVAAVNRIRTKPGGFGVIGDDALLALVAPRPAALVRLGPRSQVLVFANPADDAGFPLN